MLEQKQAMDLQVGDVLVVAAVRITRINHQSPEWVHVEGEQLAGGYVEFSPDYMWSPNAENNYDATVTVSVLPDDGPDDDRFDLLRAADEVGRYDD